LLIGIIFDDTVWMVNVLSYSIFAYNESHYRIEGHNSYRNIRDDVEGICIYYIYKIRCSCTDCGLDLECGSQK
jgi:hypothetical protein